MVAASPTVPTLSMPLKNVLLLLFVISICTHATKGPEKYTVHFTCNLIRMIFLSDHGDFLKSGFP